MLNDLEEVTEEYVERTPFCTQYVMIINGKVVPKLNDIFQQLQKLKGEKIFSPVLARRHSDLSLRLAEAMFKLSKNTDSMEVC